MWRCCLVLAGVGGMGTPSPHLQSPHASAHVPCLHVQSRCHSKKDSDSDAIAPSVESGGRLLSRRDLPSRDHRQEGGRTQRDTRACPLEALYIAYRRACARPTSPVADFAHSGPTLSSRSLGRPGAAASLMQLSRPGSRVPAHCGGKGRKEKAPRAGRVSRQMQQQW